MAALTAAGVFVLPAVASAQTVDDVVDQFSEVNVGIVQEALANSGLNEQWNTVFQGNDTVQDADASADGGEANATTDSDVADAAGGFGGDAAAGNGSESENESTGDNAQTIGAAVAVNAVSATVRQIQSNTSDNLADGPDATVNSAVVQTSLVNIGVAQAAGANSGLNFQDNTTAQGNITDQIATGSANGGNANATTADDEAVATGGNGGEAAAGNAASSSNSSTGGNSQTVGGATASNSSVIDVTQNSSNSSTNTAVSIGEAP